MRYQTLALIACVCLSGCTASESGSSSASSTGGSEAASPGSAPETATAPDPAEAMASKIAGQMPGAPGAPAGQPETELVKAGVGVGAKGRSLDDESGILVTPVKAYFSVQEKLAFEVQLKQAMDLYKATNGNFPKSQAEFDAHIKPNVRLPELKPGHEYVYDPQQGALLVKRPKQSN